MFTGLVEEVGTVVAIERAGDLVRLRIHGPVAAGGASLGDSIAVSGVCLTVTELPGDGAFAVDVIGETLNRSSLGAVAEGGAVNLERAMALGDRLGGHIVQGHVDATAALVERRDEGEWRVLRFELPAPAAPLVVEKGSITVDGVSLTVSAVTPATAPAQWFEVSLIPATLRETTLGAVGSGALVNLETDLVARHVERLLAFGARNPDSASPA
ncbi:riboflavin synthase subunit alpha [Pseudoclavibacter endophyticus]|uniref:Riboflavin synthase n=1 Tax=Pseudoclavibacter endophyticus TaxID=1778590 RepID=A0A6H9WPY4_9MICO|nr:riboflavin synthase [Pseudoclavibacter endophyticus]KAB1650198.1 riboflavin synthase [Pseudoclavibacter endophyticus]GGA56283.1 riboflavin synthase subunit alpha [Pseudoclavibacter endophyticus]